jgi:N-methylhydantoinase B
LQAQEQKIDPYLMIILPRMFESITRTMSYTMLRAGRSGVINTARDFSSSIVTGDGRLFMIEEGLPVHLGGVHLSVQAALKFFDDLAPGDCVFNNCSYTGNTHHADITLMVPVFFKNKLIFWTINRAHHADIGVPIPTTYPWQASTIYEEGINFPCVRVQRDYKDLKDIIRALKVKIRVSDQWSGDYLAQVGASRTGESRIIDLVDKYGLDTIQTFVEAWLDYSEKMMVEEIRKLPAATIENQSTHDPVPMFTKGPYNQSEVLSVVSRGIPVKVRVTIDPTNARIDVDLRDNLENLPCGLNLSHATTLAGVYLAIFNNLGDVPHNEGSLRRITVLVDEGKIVGIPKPPASTAVATTNILNRLANAIQSGFAKLGEPRGIAEGNGGQPVSMAVISGHDWRRPGNDLEINYVNQLMVCGASSGGPALYGFDGWPAYITTDSAGVCMIDSLELDELRFPILFKEFGLLEDSVGAGQWDGSPSGVVAFTTRKSPMTVSWVADGVEFPPAGVLGGCPGHRAYDSKIVPDSHEIILPGMGIETIYPGQILRSVIASGGGYGDPKKRDPESVRIRVRDGWISEKMARDVYGVAIKGASDPDKLEVDYEETSRLRKTMEGIL